MNLGKAKLDHAYKNVV